MSRYESPGLRESIQYQEALSISHARTPRPSPSSTWHQESWAWLLHHGGEHEYYGGLRRDSAQIHLLACGLNLEGCSEIAGDVLAEFADTEAPSNQVAYITGRANCACGLVSEFEMAHRPLDLGELVGLVEQFALSGVALEVAEVPVGHRVSTPSQEEHGGGWRPLGRILWDVVASPQGALLQPVHGGQAGRWGAPIPPESSRISAAVATYVFGEIADHGVPDFTPRRKLP